ncbi:MAG: hypothetical protein H0W25_06590 [Acidimicrobiia bacterium]|nr:hypothetical protein [Acidimicrobiia bacterium]
MEPSAVGPLAQGLPDLAVLYITDDGVPARINVIVTEDAARAEAAIRRVWQGPLCVERQVRPTESELHAVQAALIDADDESRAVLGRIWAAGVEPDDPFVTARITVVTPEVQRFVDERFGPGLVRLQGLLEPVPG